MVVKERAKSADYPFHEYDRVMNINAKGVAMCMAAEARAMLKQPRKLTNTYWKDPRRGQIGAIVNFASVCGFIAFPNVMAYNASKHAVMGMTRTAAIEYAENGLRMYVNQWVRGQLELEGVSPRPS